MSDLVNIQNDISESVSSVEDVTVNSVLDGRQMVVEFSNGYGASVVDHSGAYSTYEVAVLDKEGNLTYNTPVTCDVVPCPDKQKVFNTLSEIANL